MFSKRKTFKGGVHPPEHKDATEHIALERMPLPKHVVVPLSQHIGAPAKCIVEQGERVLTGQKIGESQGFVSAPVHSSISGTVIAVESRNTPLNRRVMSVVIESDGADEWVELHPLNKPLDAVTPE